MNSIAFFVKSVFNTKLKDTALTRNPFVATDKLPTILQNAHRWQQEVQGINILIASVANPDIIEGEKYLKSGDTPKGRKRMSKAWEHLLEESRRFLEEMFSKLTKKIETNLNFLEQLEAAVDDGIEQALKVKDTQKVEELNVVKNEVSSLKDKTIKQQENLEEIAQSTPTPAPSRIKQFANTVSNVTTSITQATTNFYNTMQPLYRAQQSTQTYLAGNALMSGFATNTATTSASSNNGSQSNASATQQSNAGVYSANGSAANQTTGNNASGTTKKKKENLENQHTPAADIN